MYCSSPLCFPALCDFQYLPQCTPSGPTYASLTPTSLHFSPWLGGDSQPFLPPASFSRMDTPQVRQLFHYIFIFLISLHYNLF